MGTPAGRSSRRISNWRAAVGEQLDGSVAAGEHRYRTGNGYALAGTGRYSQTVGTDSSLKVIEVHVSTMDFDEFTGEIQHRLELAGTGETVRAIRATLMTLGERIPQANAEDIAASLPLEIKWYLSGAPHEHGQRFDWREFLTRVSQIEGIDEPEAAYHAQIIVDLVSDLIPRSDLRGLREMLPESEGNGNWRKLFEVVDAGGWGDAQEAQTGGGPQPETVPEENTRD